MTITAGVGLSPDPCICFLYTMANNINYHKELERILCEWQKNTPGDGQIPRILLHSCCAPCSSYCLEYLTQKARVTVFYYNPNITSKEEYEYRLNEQKRLISEMEFVYPADLIPGEYDPQKFFDMAKGLEDAPERGPRCAGCYSMRLTETAKVASELKYDFYATTLTLSPLKPSDAINRIGLGIESGSVYLPSDFKKNNGYLRSIELSKEHGLYRQNYCGCIYSKRLASDN